MSTCFYQQGKQDKKNVKGRRKKGKNLQEKKKKKKKSVHDHAKMQKIAREYSTSPT